MSEFDCEQELRKIFTNYREIGEEKTLLQLKNFLYKHYKELTWDEWNYVIINFQFDTSFVREFKDYIDMDFMNEWALQDFIERDKDFMREFRKEMKWGESRKKC